MTVAEALRRASNTTRVPQAVPPTPQQPNPTLELGGLNFALPVLVDVPPSVTGATTSGAWPPLHESDFQPSVNTQHGAAGFSDPRFPSHGRTPYCPGTYLQTQSSLPGHTRRWHFQYRPTANFYRQQPSEKARFGEAFLFVQQVARHSQHTGRREIQELQLLKILIGIRDCRCLRLPRALNFKRLIAYASSTILP
ncbi:hypothetical protein IscW_ISCW004044, partial [Ixodes scapularis]